MFLLQELITVYGDGARGGERLNRGNTIGGKSHSSQPTDIVAFSLKYDLSKTFHSILPVPGL